MNDDQSLTRRQAMRLASAAGIAAVTLPRAFPEWLTGAVSHEATKAAGRTEKLTPELTEGPYWVNTMLRRSDVRANTRAARTAPGAVQNGVPLTLTIKVLDASGSSKPLNGLAVDIWHANAYGLYSDEGAQQSGGGTNAGDTSGEDFLRGYQITGKDAGVNRKAVAGQVSFKTILARLVRQSSGAHPRPRAKALRHGRDYRRVHDSDLLLRLR